MTAALAAVVAAAATALVPPPRAMAAIVGAYVPFLKPLPVWDHWPWLLLPLTVAIAVVYKSVKCRHMSQVPRQAAVIGLWILLALGGAAAALAVIVRLTEIR